MSINSTITDGRGSNNKASIMENGLLTTVNPYPPRMPQKAYIFRQYMTTNGLSTGTSSMKVVGSLAAPVIYYIPADATDDRYLTALSFVIAGPTPALSQFAAVAALTNGCRLYYDTIVAGQIDIHSALKTNFDFVRLCFGNPAFGATTNSFYASNVSGTSEAYIPILDFTKIVPPFGIKLEADTNQKLALSIRDDTTAANIVAFDCIAYGFDRIPEQ